MVSQSLQKQSHLAAKPNKVNKICSQPSSTSLPSPKSASSSTHLMANEGTCGSTGRIVDSQRDLWPSTVPLTNELLSAIDGLIGR